MGVDTLGLGVGVNVNTASPSLLKYVSGINKRVSDKLIDYREKVGRINSRKEIQSVLSDKVYEQAINSLTNNKIQIVF